MGVAVSRGRGPLDLKHVGLTATCRDIVCHRKFAQEIVDCRIRDVRTEYRR